MTELDEIKVVNSQLDVIPSLDLVIVAFEKIENLDRFDFGWLSISPTEILRLFYYILLHSWPEMELNKGKKSVLAFTGNRTDWTF